MRSVVIVGAGQAAVSAAFRLRRNGFEGAVTIVGDEPALPYQRPPLSKKYLTGEQPEEKLYLRPQDAYDDAAIAVRLNERAVAIDRAAKRLILAGGGTLAYDRLLLATGSRPRLLPEDVSAGFANLYPFRTLGDAKTLQDAMRPGKRILVIGGGYIGLEMAAVASKLGLAVTVIEMAERVLQRVASEATSDYFRRLHRGHGVDLREGVGLAGFDGGGGRATRARLSDGAAVDIDLAIVGIGILPNQELAADAGLEVDGGVVVDAGCGTSDPDILAAGDCAAFPYRGARIRLESVHNAIAQAEHAADVIAGTATAGYAPVPWFWSDQYDVKLQIAGLNVGFDRVVVRPGEKAGGQSVWYYEGGRLLAVDAMNDARAYMLGKRWLEAGVSPPFDRIGDVGVPLKAMPTA